jgi:hypothetical protein
MAEDTDRAVIDIEKLKKRPRERVRSDGFISKYSNSLNVEVSFSDFKFFFGEILEATDEKLRVEEFCSVIVTPEEARSISDLLIKQVAIYEATFGPIRRPPGE